MTPESMNQCWARWWMSKRWTTLFTSSAVVRRGRLGRQPLAQLGDEVDEHVEGEEEQRERGQVGEDHVEEVRDDVARRSSWIGLWAMSLAKLSVAPSWQRPQVFLRLAPATGEAGSVLARIGGRGWSTPFASFSAAPWQSTQAGATALPTAHQPAVDRVLEGARPRRSGRPPRRTPRRRGRPRSASEMARRSAGTATRALAAARGRHGLGHLVRPSRGSWRRSGRPPWRPARSHLRVDRGGRRRPRPPRRGSWRRPGRRAGRCFGLERLASWPSPARRRRPGRRRSASAPARRAGPRRSRRGSRCSRDELAVDRLRRRLGGSDARLAGLRRRVAVEAGLVGGSGRGRRRGSVGRGGGRSGSGGAGEEQREEEDQLAHGRGTPRAGGVPERRRIRRSDSNGIALDQICRNPRSALRSLGRRDAGCGPGARSSKRDRVSPIPAAEAG